MNNPNFSVNKNVRYNFRKADFNNLYYELSNIDWSHLKSCVNVNLAVSVFYSTLYSIIDKHVPQFTTSIRKYPTWFTTTLIRLIKLKEYYFRKWRRTRLNRFRENFIRLRKQVHDELSSSYQRYLSITEESIVGDPKNFWRYVHRRNGQSRIPASMTFGSTEISNPDDIVEAFATLFSEAYKPSTVIPPVFTVDASSNNFSILPLTHQEVLAALTSVKSDDTAGHDGLPNFFVKDCSPILCEPLLSIFNLSLKTSCFPEFWKLSKIIPVFKHGSKTCISNYRPINILSTCSKVFEQLLYVKMYNFVKPYISMHQHGFMSNKSTTTNLVEITQFISDALDNRQQVDVIYTDFAKAFDTIDHRILISKMSAIGFSSPATDLILSYLENRSCYVHYNGYSSNMFTASSGVAQGSKIGPLLFNIYINDLLSLVDCHVLAYADDLKLFSVVSSPSDCLALQRNLSIVDSWCKDNKITLSINKCAVVSYCNTNKAVDYVYSVGNISVPRMTTFKDLGVVFDSHLQFTDHISTVCKSASRALGFVIRSCTQFSSFAVLKTLFYSLVEQNSSTLQLYGIRYIHINNLCWKKCKRGF